MISFGFSGGILDEVCEKLSELVIRRIEAKIVKRNFISQLITRKDIVLFLSSAKDFQAL